MHWLDTIGVDIAMDFRANPATLANAIPRAIEENGSTMIADTTAITARRERAAEVGTVFDAVVVGAGFAGMYMLHRLRGLGFSARAFEAGSGVGGTWYWNRYPGARCDVESMQYSYQFSEELQQEWVWSERYAAQPEILRYANHVADRFDLRRDIRFDARVHAARFDPVENRWGLEIANADRQTTTSLV